MPFIDSKVTLKLSEEKEEAIKSRLGKAVSILGKGETYLMVGFDDEYDLYFGGEKLEKGAYVSVSLFGSASRETYNKMTEAICDILEEELDIPGDHVYVTYHGIKDWGYDGGLF